MSWQKLGNHLPEIECTPLMSGSQDNSAPSDTTAEPKKRSGWNAKLMQALENKNLPEVGREARYLNPLRNAFDWKSKAAGDE